MVAGALAPCIARASALMIWKSCKYIFVSAMKKSSRCVCFVGGEGGGRHWPQECSYSINLLLQWFMGDLAMEILCTIERNVVHFSKYTNIVFILFNHNELLDDWPLALKIDCRFLEPEIMYWLITCQNCSTTRIYPCFQRQHTQLNNPIQYN